MSTIDNSNNELNRKLKKHALAPIREHITDWMESFNVKTKRNRNGSDFCEARKRLKMGLFHRLTRYIFDISSSAAGQTFCGYRCIIADGGLFSYAALTLLTSSGSHGLFRLPAGKTKKKLSRRPAANDYLQLWERPDSRWSRFFRMLRSQPDTIVVRVITINLKRRGYRDLKLRLVTTLLDTEQVSVEDILKLYVKRWNVELDIRELKRSHLPEQLAARTPSTVKREFASGVLAYNATKMITALASEKTGNEVEARRISHTRAASLLASYFERMREADVTRLRALFNDLLIQVSRALAPIQLRPPEPRMVVRTRCRYKYLKMSRAEWREEQLA